jgi:hypothetical protein
LLLGCGASSHPTVHPEAEKGAGWSCLTGAERGRCFRDASSCTAAITDPGTMRCERDDVAYCYREQNSVDPDSHPLARCLGSEADCKAEVTDESETGDTAIVDSSCAPVP